MRAVFQVATSELQELIDLENQLQVLTNDVIQSFQIFRFCSERDKGKTDLEYLEFVLDTTTIFSMYPIVINSNKVYAKEILVAKSFLTPAKGVFERLTRNLEVQGRNNLSILMIAI